MENVTVNEMKVVVKDTWRGQENLHVVGTLTVNNKPFDFVCGSKTARFDGRETLENVGFSFSEVDEAAAKMLEEAYNNKKEKEEAIARQVRAEQWDDLLTVVVFKSLSEEFPNQIVLEGTKEEYVANKTIPTVKYNENYRGTKVFVYISNYGFIGGKYELHNRTEGNNNYKALYSTLNNAKNMADKFKAAIVDAKSSIEWQLKSKEKQNNEMETMAKMLECKIRTDKVYHSGSRPGRSYYSDIYVAYKGEGSDERKINFTVHDEYKGVHDEYKGFQVNGIGFYLTVEQMKSLVAML